MILNLVVIILVNGVYVYYIDKYDTVTLYCISSVLSGFKLLWNMRFMLPLLNYFHASAMQLQNVLILNTVIIPIAAVLFVDI